MLKAGCSSLSRPTRYVGTGGRVSPALAWIALPQGKGESEYPVVTVLHGAQYRKDHQLWINLSGNTEKDDH